MEVVMAQLVGAFGVPHTPYFPSLVKANGELGRDLERLYGRVRQELLDAKPDVLLVVSSDHFNLFFSHVPALAIGVTTSTTGPSDRVDMPSYSVSVHSDLAHHLHGFAVQSDFDVSAVYEFSLDHSFMVPYHFLAEELRAPIVPLFVNGVLGPLPNAQRCLNFGSVLRDAVRSLDDSLRVAVVASGSFSLDLGGTHAETGPLEGVPDSGWVDRIVALAESGEGSTVAREATRDQLRSAGNIGGELLNWIVMFGMIGNSRLPRYIERQGAFGHAFGAWRFNEDGGA
jgi:aromatic ring-opening dioxygenase catalytic subunit (LigB family)